MKKDPLFSSPQFTAFNRLEPSGAGISYCDSAATQPLGFYDLAGEWQFLFVRPGCSAPDGWFLPGSDCSSFSPIAVPGNWQLQGSFDEPIYTNFRYPRPVRADIFRAPRIKQQKVSRGLYRVHFNYSKPQPELKAILKFGGIQSAGNIYLNGLYVGCATDSFGTSEFDVTPFIANGDNLLAVEVLRYCAGSLLEDQDMWRISGIMRPVSVHVVPANGINDFFASCTLDGGARFRLRCETSGGDRVTASLYRGEKEEYSFETAVQKDKNGCFACIDAPAADPLLWTFENPALYRLAVRLFLGGKLIDAKSCMFGFRTVSVRRGKSPALLLNGVSIKLRGVNRHEFHPDYGFAVPHEKNESDLMLLKQNNFNAIRTSHYPPSEDVADLCDRIGLLVMCEANIETHGIAWRFPRGSRLWSPVCCERLRRMVIKYRNHPSIFMWSLGNESGRGKVFTDMYALCRSLDSTRPVHYECDSRASDVVSAMYEPTEQLDRMLLRRPVRIGQNIYNPFATRMTEREYGDRPFLLCEYAHCMGNSLGNFSWYWDRFLANERFIGGFIWDFADLVIHRGGKWLYGGDFGDRPNDGSFCMNGLVRGDRSPNPAFYEAANQLSPVRFSLSGSEAAVTYLGYFEPLKNARLSAQVWCGEKSESFSFEGLDFLPGETRRFPLTFPLDHGGESVHLSLFLSCGSTAARGSFTLKAFLPDPPAAADARCTVTGGVASLCGCGRAADIELSTGKLLSFTTESGEKVELCMLPNVFRAPPDNFSYLSLPKPLRALFNPMRYCDMRARAAGRPSTGKSVFIKLRAAGMKQLTAEYSFLTDGRLLVTLSFIGRHPLPRCGAQFSLPAGFASVTYRGLGPHENYPDRNTAALYGSYSLDADRDFHRYLKPQDAGCRTGVERAVISDGKHEITVDALRDPVCISAYPYTDRELAAAKHESELHTSGGITFNVDTAVSGVGGDKPGIACLKEQYKLKANRLYSFSFALGINSCKEFQDGCE